MTLQNEETHKAVESLRKTVRYVERPANVKISTAVEQPMTGEMNSRVERLQQRVVDAEART